MLRAFRHPFVDPVSSSTCGHTFCADCITEALSHTPQCPVDRSSLRSSDLKPAHPIIRNVRVLLEAYSNSFIVIDQLVDELVVECPNKPKGCQETPQRHMVAVHARDVCEYGEVDCPKCKSTPLRKDLGTHQLSCDRRTIQCSACNQTISFADAEARFFHLPSIVNLTMRQIHREKCPRAITACLDCGIDIPREDMRDHTETCPLATIYCVHSPTGCAWVGIREDYTTFHLPSCPYEALKGFFAIHAKENAALRQEICMLRAAQGDITGEMAKAKQALGPWFRSSHQSYTPSTQVPERLPGRRRLSSPFTNGVLGFGGPERGSSESDTPSASTSGHENAGPSISSPPMSMPPLETAGMPTLVLQDFTSRAQPHAMVPPVNVESTLEDSLWHMRNSVVALSTELESLSRRQEMHFTTEILRLHEEVASLRATVHGLRMQARPEPEARTNKRLMSACIGPYVYEQQCAQWGDWVYAIWRFHGHGAIFKPESASSNSHQHCAASSSRS